MSFKMETLTLAVEPPLDDMILETEDHVDDCEGEEEDAEEGEVEEVEESVAEEVQPSRKSHRKSISTKKKGTLGNTNAILRGKKRTAYDKKMRQSGKNTNKPYISSSMGDMCRLMMRMACTENTLGMTEPPPVQFYDYWHKFKVTESKNKIPANYVDTRRVSIPKLKMNTSSFELLAKPQQSTVSIQHHIVDTGDKTIDYMHDLNPALSDIWRGVRTSMSSESFISASTKVSEPHWEVPLEEGWSDEDDDDVTAFLSDSEDDSPSKDNILAHAPKKGQQQQGIQNGQTTTADGTAQTQDGQGTLAPAVHTTSSHLGIQAVRSKADSVMSSQSIGAKQRKEMGAVAASIMHMEMEEARLAMESALRGDLTDRDIIDHFMQDLDTTFLIDPVSYGQLPDAAFTTDFDYFNEDPIYRARELEKERLLTEALLNKQGSRKKRDRRNQAKKTKGKRKSGPVAKQSDHTDLGSESDLSSLSIAAEKTNSVGATKDVKDTEMKEDYETCLINQKKRIEDRIQAAVRSRSPMGSYKVPPGELPLARNFGFQTPGPAAYSPNMDAVKPTTIGVPLVKRWSSSIYETLGPGPAAYFPECRKCTAQILNLHESERFQKSESVGPGPGEYDVSSFAGTAKDKPHALIVSRRPVKNIGSGQGIFTNCYGINRFGRFNPPKAILIGRYPEIDKSEPGPGAYDPYARKDTKVGIILKSRIPYKEFEETPGYLDLPPLFGDTPGKSMGIRKFELLNADSPGPIYQLPIPEPKPVTMTFKPFPMPGREEEPSPIHYGTAPGEQSIIMEHPIPPRPVMIGNHDLHYGNQKIPGPNKYFIKKCNCKLPIKMKGRYPTKVEVMPGPGDYSVGNSHLRIEPRAVFQHRHKDKDLKPNSPGFVYDPKDQSRVKGGLMTPRWRDKPDEKTGPDFKNLFGFTNRGKYSKIPISLKSRHSPFVHAHLSDNPEIPKMSGCARKPLHNC